MRREFIYLLGLLLFACADHPRYVPPAPIPAGWENGNPCAQLKLVNKAWPTYPRAAAAYDQEGWVALKFHVAQNGVPFNIRVVRSSPEDVFDQASVAAMTRWRFAPPAYPVKNCSHLDIYQLQ